MTLRTRFLVILVGCVLIIALATALFSKIIYLPSFSAIDEFTAHSAAERSVDYLMGTMKSLESIASDWSAWDDAYSFVQDRNEKFITANMVDGTFSDLKINMIGIYNAVGGLVFEKTYDYEERKVLAIPEDLRRAIYQGGVREEAIGGCRVIGRLFMFGDQLWFLVAAPILPSNEEGSPLGSMIMAKRFTPSDQVALNKHSQGKVHIHADTNKGKGDRIVVREIDSRTIAAYAYISGTNACDNLIVEIHFPRTMFHYGIASIFHLFGWILLSGAIVVAVAYIMLHQWVLNVLTKAVATIRETLASPQETINIKLMAGIDRSDEIGDLAKALGRLLETMAMSQRLATIGELTAGMSHEVQNPNTVIRMNLQIMKGMLDRMPADEALKPFLTKAEILIQETLEASNRIASLTASLSQFTNLCANDLAMGIDINAIVERAAQWVQYRVKDSGAILSFRLSPSCPLVKGNAQQLEQLFINLLDNACNALERVGTVIEIATKPNMARTEVEVRIRDQGVGIAQENIARVFDPFYTTRRARGGTGLGLSISATIVKTHGGKITIASKLGEGTEITITLPCKGKDEHVATA